MWLNPNTGPLLQGQYVPSDRDCPAVAGGASMLPAHVERYISLRQTLGFKLRNTARRLQAFARFATPRNDTHIRASTAVAWAAEAPSPSARHIRLRDVVHLARFLNAEASAH